jgi:hypothetical protein
MGDILTESGQLRNWHKLWDRGAVRARLEVESILWHDKNIKKREAIAPPKLYFTLQLCSFDCIQRVNLWRVVDE